MTCSIPFINYEVFNEANNYHLCNKCWYGIYDDVFLSLIVVCY